MPSTRRGRDTSLEPHAEPDPAPGPSAWTEQQVRTLGLSTDLATAADILGISQSAAYKLAR